ncbi:alginate export family protein [Sphingobium sp. WTD-1]|uniref:alginate export family protein n=1 Tax=Sphingobium sp. WTD-1 TaxID=2979467 RepID=UPI0024DE4122|nr:alginate export family protein [Sphingobium sp. WTD-1]WIA57528.1 alginate export family protein [Sphingobium sp. WTD-1]
MPKRCLPFLALLALPIPAAAQQREAWQAPTLSITRYEEDWSDLADAEKREHHWTGPFKYIPLGDDAWLSTGVELRARVESYDDNLWGGATAPDDAYLWLRALPYADLHAGKLRAFVQPMIAYAVGVAPSAGPVDQNHIDLLQGFAEADLGPVTLRAGRQMLSLGTERLVGTRYGPNVPLAFDGARADMRIGKATVSLLAVKPVQPGLHNFDDATSDTKALWGAYATLPELDLYYLGYRNRVARFGGDAGREVRHSLGLRSHGVRGDWHWNVEGVYQFGDYEGQRIAAWTLGTEIGRSFPALPMAPDATLRFNVVSGDRKADDDKLGTFNALFPKGKYFGELSPVGPTNIISLNPRVSANLGKDVSASVAAMAYWRYSTGDGVYDIPGNLIRAPGDSDARFIGKEAEATIAWQASAEWELSASLSAFAPGAFIRNTGPAKTITMLGLESNFRF